MPGTWHLTGARASRVRTLSTLCHPDVYRRRPEDTSLRLLSLSLSCRPELAQGPAQGRKPAGRPQGKGSPQNPWGQLWSRGPMRSLCLQGKRASRVQSPLARVQSRPRLPGAHLQPAGRWMHTSGSQLRPALGTQVPLQGSSRHQQDAPRKADVISRGPWGTGQRATCFQGKAI